MRTPPRRIVRAGIGAGAIVVLLAIALAAGVGSFAAREYDKFVSHNTTQGSSQTRERLTDPGNDNRLPVWRAAVRIFDTQPLRGTGAGTYQQEYFRHRSDSLYVTDAHSLYLQSLAELGLVGLALILAVVLGILGGLAARIRGPDRALFAALFAGALAWAVHQAFDWDWQMPAVTLGLLILAGLALARPRDGRAGRSGLPANRTLVAFAWLALAVAPLLIGISYARLQRADHSLRQNDCVAAKREAISSLSLSARRPPAYVIIGVCDLEQGFAQPAVTAMSKAASLEPDNWEEQYWLAIARAGAGADPGPAIRRALALNPLEPDLRATAELLGSSGPRQWEQIAVHLRSQALSSGHFSIANL